MTEQQIQKRLDGLVKAMGAKDCTSPNAEATIKGLGDGNVYVAHSTGGLNVYKFFRVGHDDSLAATFLAADAWVAAIKDKATREDEAWTAQLGHLIDNGHAIGKDMRFLNPLIAMMEQLSTNIIEGPKG